MPLVPTAALTVIPAPAGFPDDLTARVEEPVTRRTIVVAEQPAVRDLVKRPDEWGEPATVVRETVTLDSPPEPGDYLICWRSEQRGYEAYIPLFVA